MDFYIYDTSLRDGAQSEDVQLSTPDKIKIALRLDSFGIQCIEGGWPGANPVDNEFFEEIKQYPLKNAKIAAFGSTHHTSFKAEDDPTMKALVLADVPIITIFGKSSEKHALDALRISPERNLEIIYNSVAFLKKHAKTVFFDAEHFFDGFKANKDYALQVIKNAHKAGANTLVLCDSNGGTLPSEVSEIMQVCRQELPDAVFGIHAHNDCELAGGRACVHTKSSYSHSDALGNSASLGAQATPCWLGLLSNKA